MNSQGSAMSENEKVLDSIEGKVNAFKSAFEELSKSVINSDFIKGIVDLGTSLLKFLNSDTMKFLATFTTTLITLRNLGKAKSSFGGFFDGMLKNLDTIKKYLDYSKMAKQTTEVLGDNFSMTSKQVTALTTAEEAQILKEGDLILKKAALSTALGLVSAAITVGITLWQKHKQEVEAAAEASKNAAEEMASSSYSSFEETNKKISEYEDTIKSAKKTMEEYSVGTSQYNEAQKNLKDTQEQLINSYPSWKEQIEKTNNSLDEQLNLLKEISQEEAKKTEANLRDNKNIIEEQFDIGNWTGEDVRRYGFTLEDIVGSDDIDNIIHKMQQFGDVVEDYADELGDNKSFAFSGDNIMEAYNAYEKFYNYLDENGEKELNLTEKQIEALKDKISTAKSAINADYDYEKGVEGLQQYGEAVLAASDDYQKFIDKITELGERGLLEEDYINSLLKGDNFLDGTGDAWSKEFEEISEWLNILGYTAEDFVKEYNKADNKMKSFMSEVDTKRLWEYKDALEANSEQWENYDEKMNKVISSYNLFWEELQASDNKSVDTISKLLEKYPLLQEALVENGKTIDDVAKSIEDYGLAASNFYNMNDLTDVDSRKKDALEDLNEQYEDVIEKLKEYGFTLEDIEDYENSAIRIFDEISERLDYTSLTTDEIKTNIEGLNTDIEKLSSSYSTLTGAIAEYNESGYLTLDTLNNLLNLEDGWLEALSLENGKMVLNESVIKDIANARLDEAEALAIQTAYSELQTIAEGGEAAAVDYLKNKYGELNTKLGETSLKYEDVAEAALKYKAVEGISSSEVQAIDDIKNSLDKRLDLISSYRSSINKNLSGSMGGSSSSSSSSSSSKEWWEIELEKLKEQFKYNEITIEEYINGLSNLLGKVNKGTDAWRQINEELQKQRLTKVEDDYKRGTISLDEYIKKLKELIKAYKQGTDAWNDLADKIKDALQDKLDQQKDDLETAEKAAIGLIDEEIEKLEQLRDEKEEYYDKLIADKEAANKETERELELARLEEALENAKNEKNKRIWHENLGWVIFALHYSNIM